jgi:hypothetical protein
MVERGEHGVDPRGPLGVTRAGDVALVEWVGKQGSHDSFRPNSSKRRRHLRKLSELLSAAAGLQ